ncbi:hypothetical protein ACFQT0_18385 [Hymenobacter humi]|uniref:Uncharacterized protein n=1 Tax=Hymenobacter humi TaxID=1411620 RepID=A0ABW2U7M7_9BACT
MLPETSIPHPSLHGTRLVRHVLASSFLAREVELSILLPPPARKRWPRTRFCT